MNSGWHACQDGAQFDALDENASFNFQRMDYSLEGSACSLQQKTPHFVTLFPGSSRTFTTFPRVMMGSGVMINPAPSPIKRLLPTNSQRKRNLKVEYNFIDGIEPMAKYRPGGYHTISIGDTLKKGR